jgi:hypothetical protein
MEHVLSTAVVDMPPRTMPDRVWWSRPVARR